MQETFLTEFEKRGYFSQCTDRSGLGELMSKAKIKTYIGFDCTAPSLHVGSLMQIMCLRLLQKYGHQPIVLLGGGTTLIGDPSGKEETRKILNKKEIDKNIKSIEDVFKIFLKSKNSKTKPIFVNNYSWLSKLNYINFLREIGKHFTVNKMLTFDSVKLRLEREQSLSYMEFNYMMLQAYDFYELNKRHKFILQIGGSDQWGNIVNGIIAKSGKVNKIALDKLLENFYGKENILSTEPIQSFDTNYFDFSFVKDLSLEDGVATLTEFTAQIIISALKTKDYNKEKIILCGGGRKNNFLVERLKEENKVIKLIDEYGVDGDFVESQAFAYLAIRSYLKLPISFPSTTGVSKPCTGGVIIKY